VSPCRNQPSTGTGWLASPLREAARVDFCWGGFSFGVDFCWRPLEGWFKFFAAAEFKKNIVHLADPGFLLKDPGGPLNGSRVSNSVAILARTLPSASASLVAARSHSRRQCARIRTLRLLVSMEVQMLFTRLKSLVIKLGSMTEPGLRDWGGTEADHWGGVFLARRTVPEKLAPVICFGATPSPQARPGRCHRLDRPTFVVGCEAHRCGSRTFFLHVR